MSETFRTKNGQLVRVRRMSAKDAPHLLDIFDHLSPDSRYRRFHEPLESVTPEFAQNLADEIVNTTMSRGRGWLAFTRLDGRDTPVGGVRWVRTEPDVAEMALTIRDDMQGQGIGRELLRIAILAARSAGIKKLVAVLQATNQAMIQLLRHTPVPMKRVMYGSELFIEADLTVEPNFGEVERILI